MTFLFKEPNVDAFGRQMVTVPFTLGDYKHLYGIDPNFLEYITNGATVAYQSNKACARLTTSSNSASRIVHQSKFYHHYMPGKSQLILSSFNFYTAVPNVTKRTGYFDDNNGIYFEQTGDGTLSFVIRSYVSGSVVETRVPQSSWNRNKCNGVGPNAWTIDITKTQLIFIDFQWLGVGRVRVGFVHDGEYIVAHVFDHSNALPTVYMSTPNLPVRCEVVNVGTTTGGFIDQICSTVVSEGGYVEAGSDWAVASPTLRTLAAGATLPILAIRLKNAYKTYPNRMIAKMGQVNILSTGANIKYRLIKLPNISQLTVGGSWVSVDDDSGVEYMAGATAFTDGDEHLSGFVAASSQNLIQTQGGAPTPSTPSSAKKNYIVQNYDSTDSEIYVLVATNIHATDSTTVGVSMQWREIY
jgi:hypothetical protein